MNATTTTSAPTIERVKDLIDLTASMVTSEGVEISLNASELADIVEGVNVNLHLRDYLLGLPSSYTLAESISIVQYFRDNLAADDEKVIPFSTVMGAFYFEMNAPELAELLNSHGLEEEYPLAKLLSRVYAAGWPAGAFASMREDLHKKVVAALEESKSELIA
jgi:hypothetical protein